ncbi:hypothetical protein ACFY05_20575 [Microtetraspora fusca]|uniref:DUF4190 domain-containing protein n=1 Tax=Microtetraspora fusca TaxID=1997 RepID=A0ABW6V8H8_MICFU
MTTPDKPAWEPQRDQRPDDETRPDEQRLVLPVNSWDEPDLEGSWWEPSGYREPDPVRPEENRSAFREIAADPARTDRRPPVDPLGGDRSDRRERDLSRRRAESGETDFSDWTDCGFSDDLAATDPGYRSWAEPETTWESLKAWAAQDPLASESPYEPPAPQHPGATGPDTGAATGQRDRAGNGGPRADAGAYGAAAAGHGTQPGPEAAYGTPEARYGAGPEAPAYGAPEARYGPESPGYGVHGGEAPGYGEVHGYGAYGGEAPGYGRRGGPEAAGYGAGSGHEAPGFGGPEAPEQRSLPPAAIPSQVPPAHAAQPPQVPPYTAPGAPQTSPPSAGAAQVPPHVPSQSGPPGRPGGPYDEQPPGTSPGVWNDPYAGPASGGRQTDPHTDRQPDAPMDGRPDHRIGPADDPYTDGRYGMSADASGLPRAGAESPAAYPSDTSAASTGWGLPPALPYPPQNSYPPQNPDPAPTPVPPSAAAPAERVVCEHCGMPPSGAGSSRPGTAFGAHGYGATGAFGAPRREEPVETGGSDVGARAFGTQGSGQIGAGPGAFEATDVATGPMERLGVPGGQSAQDRPVWSTRPSPGEPYAGEGAATRGLPAGGSPAAGHVHVLKAENQDESYAWEQGGEDYVRIVGKDSGTERPEEPEEPQGRPSEYGERFPTPPRPPEEREPSERFGDRTPPADGGQPPTGDQRVHPGEPGRHGGAVYYQQPRRRGEGLGTAAMVLGIVSIILLFFCGVGALTALAGAVLGVVALAVGSSKGRAVTGIVLSVLTLVLAAVIGVVFYNWFQTNKIGECFDVRTHPTQASTQRCIEEKLSGSGLTG